jgi:hypothetical protein
MMLNPRPTEIATLSPPRRGLSSQFHRLALAFALLAGGCAGTSSRITSDEYYRDAQLCRAQNFLNSKTTSRHQAGTPSEEAIVGVDTARYLQCMARLGWQQDAKTDPVLRALEKCQRRAERRKVTAESGGAKPSVSLDQTAYRECLRQRGLAAETTADSPKPRLPK